MKKRDRIKSGLKLVGLLYLFILSIELIKRASLFFAKDIQSFFSEGLLPLKAICVGWFSTSIFQSSSAISSIVAAFAGNNLISLNTSVFILVGASIGAAITALIISLVTEAKKRRDFRHGFEIGLCYAIYSILVVIVVVFLEYFFKLFSRLSLLLASLFKDKISILKIPDIVGFATSPITDFLFESSNKFLLFFIAFLILIFTLKYIGNVIMDILGGEKKARKFINRNFNSKYKSYLIGVFLTAIVFSSGITTGLLVPLAVSRLINLKKAIPFIIGARLGTSTDLFLASIVIGKTPAIATAFAYLLFGVLGALIFLPNTEFLFKITKYTSKRLIHISRKKALYVLIAFILIPLLIVLIF
ncbi:MAG: Na/Pi symporter [archaeon]